MCNEREGLRAHAYPVGTGLGEEGRVLLSSLILLLLVLLSSGYYSCGTHANLNERRGHVGSGQIRDAILHFQRITLVGIYLWDDCLYVDLNQKQGKYSLGTNNSTRLAVRKQYGSSRTG